MRSNINRTIKLFEFTVRRYSVLSLFIILSIFSTQIFPTNNDSYNPEYWHNQKDQPVSSGDQLRFDEIRKEDDKQFAPRSTGIPYLDAAINVALLAYCASTQGRDRRLENNKEAEAAWLRRAGIPCPDPQQQYTPPPQKPQPKPEPQLPPMTPQQREIHQRFEQDFPEYVRQNNELRDWCLQHFEQIELFDRFKWRGVPTNDPGFPREYHSQLPSDLSNHLREYGVDPDNWSNVCYNNIQCYVHADSMRLLRRTMHPFKSDFLNDCRGDIVQTLDAGRAFNAQGYCSKAGRVNDFCAVLMDYGEATLGGAASGICEALNYAWEHKGALVIGGAAAIAIAGYPAVATALTTAVVVANVAPICWEIGQGLGEWICEDKIALDERLNRNLGPFFDKKAEIDAGTRGLKDCVRDVAQSGGLIGAEILLTRGAGTIIQKAAKHAGKVIKKIGKPGKERYQMVTPDGHVVDVVDDATKAQHRLKSANSKIDTEKNIPQATRTIEKAAKKFTTKEATEMAEKLGFKKTNYFSHGQPIFKKGSKYITIDMDQHNGGVWKMADSVENLSRKSTRLGTYDEFLNRIGD